MDREESQTRALVNRALPRNSFGLQRKKALHKLMDLTKTGTSTLKMLAASELPKLLNDFPELEEAAINAVYDLCEDHTVKARFPAVRTAGYRAITEVSRAAGKLRRSNAATDEQAEVKVVKDELIEHLDIDASTTLTVLCDQIMPAPPETTDPEEIAIRARLRTLVLEFLEVDVVRRVQGKPGTAETALVEALLTAIPALSATDTEVVVKRILVRLPSVKRQSDRLLQVLLDTTNTHLKAELKQHGPLITTKTFLDLIAYLVMERKLAPPDALLRFYLTHLVAKMTLHQLIPADQVFVICNMAETLAMCDVVQWRHLAVDSSPNLFECLAKADLQDTRTVNACKTLLESCMRRKASGWALPSHFRPSLDLLRTKAEQAKNTDVQDLIRSLCPVQAQQPQNGTQPLTNRPPPPPAQRALPTAPVALMRSRPLGLSPVASTSSTSFLQQQQQPRRFSSSSLVLNENKHKHKHGLAAEGDSSPRPQKRLRTADSESDSTPSLLTRLGGSGDQAGPAFGPGPAARQSPRSAGAGAARRGFVNGRAAAEVVAMHPGGIGNGNVRAPAGGLSIKGAASKAAAANVQFQRDRAPQKPASLLDRLAMNEMDAGGGGKRNNQARW
ncbi:hypothetical protein HMN09_00727500 [Mycena chlorophos]|uniref:Uncharacterized protein n=1 Tax=Mycena chlorophos TaxID=658473 RepID=A0A8H6SW27_MYCCL|nr:hypothetical protein HMN09_00727500 [Mycena chlorophos]